MYKRQEPAKDRNKQNRENKNRVKKVIDTGKEKGITSVSYTNLMLQAGKTVAEPTSARAVSVWRKPEKITDWSVL